MKVIKRRLPPVPFQAVALEPEQQVESAAAATGYPQEAVMHKCCQQRTTPR